MRKFEQSLEFTAMVAQWIDIINSHDVNGSITVQVSTKDVHRVKSLPSALTPITYSLDQPCSSAEDISGFAMALERMARSAHSEDACAMVVVDVKFFATKSPQTCLAHYRWKVREQSFAPLTSAELSHNILPGWDFCSEEPDVKLPISDAIYQMSFFDVTPGFYSLVLDIEGKPKTLHRFAKKNDGTILTLGNKESYLLKHNLMRCLYADQAAISVYRLNVERLDQQRVHSSEAISRMCIDDRGWTTVRV